MSARWPGRFLLQSPKGADGTKLVGGLGYVLSPLLWKSFCSSRWHHGLYYSPPSIRSGCCNASASPNSQLLYNLTSTPFCRGISKQILHSLLPKHLPGSRASWIRLLLDKVPNSATTIHVWLRSQVWALGWRISWSEELLSTLALQALICWMQTVRHSANISPILKTECQINAISSFETTSAASGTKSKADFKGPYYAVSNVGRGCKEHDN